MTTRTTRQLRRSAAALALALVACGSPSSPDNDVPQTDPSKKLEWADDSVIVKFKSTPTMNLAERGNAISRVRGFVEDLNKDGIYDRFAHIGKGELAMVRLEKGMTPDEAIAQLRDDPAIEYAERNWIVRTTATPNDPRFNELYGLHNTGQTGGTAGADIDAVAAWDNSIGSASVVVGIIDTGIDFNHEDLAANVFVNPGEIPGNGIDDDANGVIDDVHGFNAINNSGNPLDDNDHGSHCAGTIGAVGNNGIGVAGVNWEVSMMGIKFLNAGGSGTTEGAIASVNYAVMMRNRGVNLRVLSNSWGGGGFSQALLDAIVSANNAGILFVAAAGNSASDNDSFPHFPSSYEAPNVLAVAATTHNDARADFSSFGLTSVDVGAPGEDILSTTIGNTYSVFSGTSMATPHVSGLAALMLSQNDTLTVEELKTAIMISGDPIPALAGITVTGRRINAANALDEAGPPIPRFNLAATPAAAIITQGDTASVGVAITSVAGFTGNVSVTATSNPPINATITVTPPVVAAPGSSTVSIATSTATAPGTYNITVTGTSGALVKSRTVSVRVRAFGTVEIPFPSTDTPRAIPENNPTGVSSVINVPQSITIEEVNVQVDITHTFIGDLVVTLTSPTGTSVVLHNRAGGGTDNLHQLFNVPGAFTGQDAIGNWTLLVQDLAAIDVGTLDSWELRIVGVPNGAGFDVTASPASATATQGGSASYDVAVTTFGGFNNPVALSASAPGFDGTFSFSPSTVPGAGTSVLTATTTCNTAPGTYNVTINATSGTTTDTTTVQLVVTPFGVAEGDFTSTDNPVSIPDNNPVGARSTLVVSDANFELTALTVDVNITHTFIGDLEVRLIGPNGQFVVLHDNTGGGANDIHQTFDVSSTFAGISIAGAWQIFVVDSAGLDVGTIDAWTLHATGAVGNFPPTAAFSFTQNNLAFQFLDASTDGGCAGGSVAAWAWDFGDGATSNLQNPTHTYALPGTYTVTLTVTDADGATGTTSQQVTATRPTPILNLQGIIRNRAKFQFTFDFTWSGAAGALVEFYRNAFLQDIPDNDGVQRYTFRAYETAYVFVLCEQFSTFCSNTVSVDFGPNPVTATEAKIRDASGNIVGSVRITDETDSQ